MLPDVVRGESIINMSQIKHLMDVANEPQRHRRVAGGAIWYKGTGPAVTDLLGGRIDMMFSPSTTVQALIDGGQLKALATTGAKRSKFFPKVPTVAEDNLPGYSSVGWFGLLAPAHTPKDIVAKLNKAVVAIMAMPDVIEHMAKLGAEPEPQAPDEFGRYINADVAKWAALVREQNITLPGAGK